MKNIDSISHVRGESIYLDDIPLVQGTLYACVFDSPLAHGKLRSIDTANAETSKGVIRDEPLLAEDKVHFQGMPIAIVVATSEELARRAAKKITANIDPLEPIT